MRKARAIKKPVLPDPKFSNETVAKFINFIMERGKRNAARNIVYGAFEIIYEKTKKDPVETFDLALKNVGPVLEIKGRRIGGANYQIPYEVKGDRKNTLAFRWIVEAARSQKGKSMAIKLANQIMEASQNQGAAIKKKEDTHRMAEANKAFAHYAR
ncbi:30S ribosomal protein S7 [Patescibacteria group bacterium]|nr:30S ribosomal protein S7 [Patescibacteria group bacterium]